MITVVTTDASPVGVPHMEHVALQEANQALDTIHEISQILDTGLDKETLNILIALCETGVNPEVTSGILVHSCKFKITAVTHCIAFAGSGSSCSGAEA